MGGRKALSATTCERLHNRALERPGLSGIRSVCGALVGGWEVKKVDRKSSRKLFQLDIPEWWPLVSNTEVRPLRACDSDSDETLVVACCIIQVSGAENNVACQPLRSAWLERLHALPIGTTVGLDTELVHNKPPIHESVLRDRPKFNLVV